MRTIGIQELEGRLGEAVRRVREGEHFLVTEHGEVVAELRRPNGHAALDERHPNLGRKIREGRISPAAPNRPENYPSFEPLLAPGRVQELLDEDRGSR